SLTLAISGISYSITWAAMKDAAPFPVLSKLSVSGGYPFDDDLLFRGNGGTMMGLRIPFSAVARNALGRFGVLKHGGVTQMTKVSIDEVTSLDKEFLAGRTDVPIKQQVHGILEVARSLSTKDYTMGFPVSKIKDIAYTAMLLAVLCPNFACVDISPSLRNAFGREIAWAAFNFPFEEHADTLRRLIYRK
ncbi:hypothetical protein IWW39_005977, partial [Coemansia spiralis]